MQEVSLDGISSVRFKLGSKHWDVTKPNMGQAKKLQTQLQAEGVDEFEVMAGFLDTLGLPKAVVETLTIEQLTVVTESLIPAKKN